MKPQLIELLEKELNIVFYDIPYGNPTSKSKSYYVNNKGFLHELNLNNLNLNSIPEAFYSNSVDLETIQVLNLRSNRIQDLGSFLHKMPNLISLDLRNNRIVDIEIFSELKAKLNSIYLDDNHIFDLTPFYKKLKSKQITQFSFTNNPIVYPAQSIKNSNDFIKTIDSNNSFVENLIKKNEESKEDALDLGNLGITDLSWFPNLLKCTHLKTLILSNEWAEYNDDEKRWERKESKNKGLKNNLFNISSEISKLKGIETLIVGGDWKSRYDDQNNNWRLKDVSSIFKLKKLSFLNISNNRIEDISGLLNLTSLEIAHINNNRIAEVPDLSNLPQLREVYLSNNQIENIKFLISSIQLETVDLHSNKIDNLIPLETLLRSSKTGISIKDSSWEKRVISVSKNSPKIVPPYEIFDQGNEGFFLYLKQMRYEESLKLDKYYNKEIKIILVGNSSAGKSTMLNYLKTKRFKKNIPVTHWLVTEELQDVKIDKDIFKLRFFDFGGQDYYHDTHKMFFSGDSVYLLLWDKESNRLDEIDDDRESTQKRIQVFPLEYWLDAIKIYAKKSLSESQRQMAQLLDERDRNINIKIRNRKIGNWIDDVVSTSNLIAKIVDAKNTLIIQNKIDRGQGYLNQYLLTEVYPSIYDFTNVSLLKSKGKKDFEELYFEIIKKNPNYNRPLLATWGFIKDNLNDVFKNDDFIIPIKTFKERINSYLTNWLKKDWGKKDRQILKILFDEDDIILFANFLKEIGLVIYNSEKAELKDSIIVHQNKFLEGVYKILELAKDNNGKFQAEDVNGINQKDLVIKTLVNHKIVLKDKQTTSYIAPLFLPEKPDFLVDLLADLKAPFRRFRFKGFIPKSIILSIFSEVIYKQDISDEDFYYWKNGLIFKDKETLQKVFLKFNIGYEYGFAYIDVFNFKSNENDKFIKEFIKIISKVINDEGIEKDELLTLDGIYFIEIEKLLFRYENKINYITAKDFDDKKSKQINVYKYNKLLEDKMKKPNKKLFISYSKQDEKLVNNFIDHLSSLQSMGIIESWYCTELKGGEDWDVTIKEKLNEADIVCFMISPKFMSTPYIHKYEVKHTFKRYEKGEDVKIIPIVLDYVDWSRTYSFQSESGEEIAWTLNKFTALPFTQKEIKEFENENKAWYLIVQAIKTVIEEDINSEKDEDEIVRKFPPNIRKIYEDIIEGKGIK